MIEHAIEALISMLDEFDGDGDFESDDTEEQHDTEAEETWKSFARPPLDAQRLTGVEVLHILKR